MVNHLIEAVLIFFRYHTDTDCLRADWEHMPEPRISAVSYTHLDVYKRQHLLSLQWTGFVPLSDMKKVYSRICSFFFRCGHCENAGSQRFLPVSYTHLLAAIGKPLFKVGEVDRMYLRAYITSEQLSKVKLGDQDVSLDNCPQHQRPFRTMG